MFVLSISLYFLFLCISPQKKCSSVQLFSKMFDEVEKIRCWKVQTDSDVTEKERKLQENKRVIESQSRTIQELQVYITCLAHFLFKISKVDTNEGTAYSFGNTV